MPLDHRILLFPSTLVVAFSSPPKFSQSANKLLTRHAARGCQEKLRSQILWSVATPRVTTKIWTYKIVHTRCTAVRLSNFHWPEETLQVLCRLLQLCIIHYWKSREDLTWHPKYQEELRGKCNSILYCQRYNYCSGKLGKSRNYVDMILNVIVLYLLW